MQAETKKTGCHNRPLPNKTLLVQDGWTSDGRRRMVRIKHNFERGGKCPYLLTNEGKNDAGCIGCVHEKVKRV